MYFMWYWERAWLWYISCIYYIWCIFCCSFPDEICIAILVVSFYVRREWKFSTLWEIIIAWILFMLLLKQQHNINYIQYCVEHAFEKHRTVCRYASLSRIYCDSHNCWLYFIVSSKAIKIECVYMGVCECV